MNEDELMKDATVYYEVVMLPLFCFTQEVVLAETPRDARLHLEEMYKGLNLSEVTGAHLGYSCIMHHAEFGTKYIIVIIASEESEMLMPGLIAQEAVSTSWNIMEALKIDVYENNHRVQDFIVCDITNSVHSVYRKFVEGKSDLKDL